MGVIRPLELIPRSVASAEPPGPRQRARIHYSHRRSEAQSRFAKRTLPLISIILSEPELVGLVNFRDRLLIILYLNRFGISSRRPELQSRIPKRSAPLGPYHTSEPKNIYYFIY